MALSEKTIEHVMGLYAANWTALRQSNGMDEYLRWFARDDVDDWTVSEAMRRIIKERMDEKRLDPMKDKPRLIELQAVYFKVLNEKRDTEMQNEVIEDCDYCLNYGYRWIVVHFNGNTSSENPITAVPEDVSKIRQFVDKYSLPCTCRRGIDYKNHLVSEIKKDGRYVRPVDYDKQSYILGKYSMLFNDAQKLIYAYSDAIKAKYHPEMVIGDDEKREIRDKFFQYFMKQARQRIPQEVKQQIIESKKEESFV